MSDDITEQAEPETPWNTLRHPSCDHEASECRVSTKSRVATQLAWEPIFDGNGRLCNEDPNTFETDYECTCCKRAWTVRRTGSREELVNR